MAPSIPTKDWRAISAAKIASRDALIPVAWRLGAKAPGADVLDVMHVPETSGILSSLELKITETPAQGILKHIASGQWTSRAVTEALCKRAAIAHQLVSTIIGSCFPAKS